MKKIILMSATVLFIALTAFAEDGIYNKKWYVNEYPPTPGFSKDLRFDVHGKYNRPVKKAILNDARFISDFIPGYPTSWITDYVSVEIRAINDGTPKRAVSTNATLNEEQKNILKSVDLATDVVVSVTHKFKNPANDKIEKRETFASLTVVPDIEAEFIGGRQQMIQYLKEQTIDNIPEKIRKEFQGANVSFTVNEQGEIANTKISRTSGDLKTDQIIIESINKMPKWKPAQNLMGIKVKQEFEFSIYGGMDGC